MQEPSKPRFLDYLERAGPEHFPVVEPLDENRPIRQIEHGPRAEYSNHLAHPNFVVCHCFLTSSGAAHRGR
jgi:hypothetical protein